MFAVGRFSPDPPPHPPKLDAGKNRMYEYVGFPEELDGNRRF